MGKNKYDMVENGGKFTLDLASFALLGQKSMKGCLHSTCHFCEELRTNTRGQKAFRRPIISLHKHWVDSSANIKFLLKFC